MKFLFHSQFAKREAADLLIVPIWEGEQSPLLKGKLPFLGKSGEIDHFYLENEKEPRWLLLGLGKKGKSSSESIRRAFAAAVKAARAKKAKSIQIVISKFAKEELRALFEGVLLANDVFVDHKHDTLKENSNISQIGWIGLSTEEKALLEKTQKIVEGVYFIRSWVNRNSDDKNPKAIADVALGLEKLSPKIKVEILDKKRLEAEKMGLILAVNRASHLDPYMAVVTYKGNPKSKDLVVLVGKGITYDTGGLRLKPADNMMTMKSDMAGAATVLGAVQTAAALNLKVNLAVVTPLTENAIGPKSYKLGDVYRSHAGKMVEVNDTDAEGRLVLADAISYAIQNLKPSCLIDLATLTGTIVIALGEDMAGLFSNDERLAKELMEASASSGELLWRMPIHADYKESLKSEYGDLLNSGGREGGAIKAALFLQEFVTAVPWAHIDIAGPAFLSKPKHYHPTKATGYALRLLIDFLESRAIPREIQKSEYDKEAPQIVRLERGTLPEATPKRRRKI